MPTETKTDVLSPGDAMALGDLLTAINAHKRVRWLAEDDQHGAPREGELRSLVVGPSLAMAPWGTDVRDMHVWVSTGITETTFSVRWAMRMLPDGGMVFE